jgi:hypothetical protein
LGSGELLCQGLIFASPTQRPAPAKARLLGTIKPECGRACRKGKGGYGRPPLDYFLTSPGAGVGLGAPELSFSAGIILWEPADPVVGDGFDFVPPVEPFGLRSTAQAAASGRSLTGRPGKN